MMDYRERYKIGRKLAALRKRKNLTQSELAEIIGISQNAISNWELGARLPSTETAEKVAYVLGRDMDEIFGEDYGKIEWDLPPYDNEYSACNIAEKVGEAIHMARTMRGLTAVELGNKMFCVDNTVRRNEKGQGLTAERVAEYAKALDVSYLWLISGGKSNVS